MHWFDVGAAIALLIGGVWSFFRGLTREVLSILGMIAAFVLSAHGYPYVADFLRSLVTQLWLRQAIGFGVIFVATTVFYILFAKLAHHLVKAAGLSLPDKVLGGLFGILKVGVMISALLLITTQFFPSLSGRLITRSILAPTFFRAANLLSMFLPEGTSDEFHRAYRRFQRQFPAWRALHTPPSASSKPPGPAAPHTSPLRLDGISERDAQALERILRERLQDP